MGSSSRCTPEVNRSNDLRQPTFMAAGNRVKVTEIYWITLLANYVNIENRHNIAFV